MELIIKKFNELTVDELFAIAFARQSVFIVEQKCAYNDLDEYDKIATHVFYYEDGKVLAYLRVLDKETKFKEVSLGRIITTCRGVGLGAKIVEQGLRVALTDYSASVVTVGAQLYAKGFYEKQGFKQRSEIYMEDGIEHIIMNYDKKSVE